MAISLKLKKKSQSLKQFFLTVCQSNVRSKIQLKNVSVSQRKKIFEKILPSYSGVDSFLNQGSGRGVLAVVGGAKSAHPGSNRVNWSAKLRESLATPLNSYLVLINKLYRSDKLQIMKFSVIKPKTSNQIMMWQMLKIKSLFFNFSFQCGWTVMCSNFDCWTLSICRFCHLDGFLYARVPGKEIVVKEEYRRHQICLIKKKRWLEWAVWQFINGPKVGSSCYDLFRHVRAVGRSENPGVPVVIRWA